MSLLHTHVVYSRPSWLRVSCHVGTYIVIAASSAFGQTGQISGVVNDPNHAMISGASVKLENEQTESVITASTNLQGAYSFSHVPAGNYRLTVEAPGFSTSEVDIAIASGGSRTQDFDLTIAGNTQSVEVTSRAFVEPALEQTSTESMLTKEAITLLGTPAQSNLLKPLDLLPSLHVDTADPYGLTSRLPYNIRSRGQAGIGMSTVIEGVPIWAIETPGPRVDMLDLENVASMTYYTGGVPPNLGLGGQDTAGAIDLRLIKPGDAFSLTADQSNGSWSFNRTFVRLDSGKLPTDTRFYASYSYTGDDKWKGIGSNYRHHGSIGVTQTFSPRVTAEVFADFNSELAYAYKTLTYAQIQNLPGNYKLDYNTTLTGNATADASYYAFNDQRDRDFNLVGKLAIQLPGESVLTWKPYYWTEYQPAESVQMIPGTSLTGVRIRTNYFDREGSVLEWSGHYHGTDILAGYWMETFNLPIGEKYYTVGANGSLVFNRWALDQPSGRGLVNSPYLSIARSFFRNLHIALGFRYLDMQNPGQIGYITSSTGDMSYQQALRNNQGVDAAASFAGKTQRVALPNAGASYRILPGLAIYANYGRNYARPQSYPELMQTFLSARAAYTAASVNMQYLYDKFGLTRADDCEAGLRYESRHFHVTPSVFYNRYYDKLLTVWDPIAARTIRQAIGNSRVRGFELEGGATPLRGLTFFSSFSYNSSALLSNLYTAANAFVER